MTRHPWETEQPSVHLVVMGERGGLFGIYLEKERAHRYAESINGVVVALPVSGDYRKTSGTEEEAR